MRRWGRSTWLRDQAYVEYTYATDDQALEAFRLSKLEELFLRWNPPMQWQR